MTPEERARRFLKSEPCNAELLRIEQRLLREQYELWLDSFAANADQDTIEMVIEACHWLGNNPEGGDATTGNDNTLYQSGELPPKQRAPHRLDCDPQHGSAGEGRDG